MLLTTFFLVLFFFEDFFTGVFLGDNLTPSPGNNDPRGAVILAFSALGSYSSGDREKKLPCSISLTRGDTLVCHLQKKSLLGFFDGLPDSDSGPPLAGSGGHVETPLDPGGA